LLRPGRYELTQGELVINGTLFIVGPGARSTTIEQLAPHSRVIDVQQPMNKPQISFDLIGVTVTGGSTDDSSPEDASGAGMRVENVGIVLSNDAIVGNHAFSSASDGVAGGA